MDEKTSLRVVELLRASEEELLASWVAQLATSLRGRITRQELERDIRGLYDALLDGLEHGAVTARGAGLAEARAVLGDLTTKRARQGFTPSETAIAVFALKPAVLQALETDGSAERYRDFAALSDLVDDLGLYTFEVYSEARERVISDQAEQLMELSTPVVKLWDGVLAVPLVGTLDSARTQVVMEKLLQMLVETGSDQAIIDITGVPAVDTQVAQHLLKTVVAARLMGADCTISGIRPQIAQTIVSLGIEFGDIPTKAALADALLEAFRDRGLEVVASR